MFARLENSDFPDADAILFHERNFDLSDLPRPEDRRPEQMYVHFTLESPFWSQEGNVTTLLGSFQINLFKAFTGSFQHYFNISLSYRSDANIKSQFYDSVLNIKQLQENLTQTIQSFGAKNQHLAQKKSPVGILIIERSD